MTNRPESQRKWGPHRYAGSRGEQPTRPSTATEDRASTPAIEVRDSQAAKVRTAQCTMQPETDPPAVSKPLSAYDDDPVLDSQGAAFVGLLKKWRQRRQGPDFIQYGAGGSVRYEVKALLEIRDAYRVRVYSKL